MKVRWNNPKNSLCAWGYICEIICVMVWEDHRVNAYRITVGNIRLKKTFRTLEEAKKRVEKKWEVYAGMVRDKIVNEGVPEWEKVNQFGYASKEVCGVLCRVEPLTYGDKKGRYRAVIGHHRNIEKERMNVNSAMEWIDGYLVKAIERRMGE